MSFLIQPSAVNMSRTSVSLVPAGVPAANSLRRMQLNVAFADRKARQFSHAGKASFPDQILTVRFDRSHAQTQGRADLLVRKPARDETKHIDFSRRQISAS